MKRLLICLLAVLVLIAGYTFVQFMNFSAVSKGSKIPQYKKSATALLVIDVQNDLTQKDGKAVLNPELTDKMIEKTNTLIERSKKLGLIVVYVRHEFKKGLLTDYITKGALAEGSQGSQIDPRIKVINNNIFVKHVMDSFSNVEFEDFLKKNEVNTLYITGLDAAACIDRTVKAALKRNYEVLVLEDCIASKNKETVTKKLDEFKKLGAVLTASADVLVKKNYDLSSYNNTVFQ